MLVPHGWHGPAMAAPGYDLYYLNVMAGPGERAWQAATTRRTRGCATPGRGRPWTRACPSDGAAPPWDAPPAAHHGLVEEAPYL